MSVVTIVPKEVSNAGVVLEDFIQDKNATADFFKNNGECFIYVKNGDATPIDVTVSSDEAIVYGGVPLAYDTITVPATSSMVIAKIYRSSYGDIVKVVCTGTAVKVGAFYYDRK